MELGLAGEHQRLNAALAVTLVRTWVQRSPSPPPALVAAEKQLASSGALAACYLDGLASCHWPGRAQVREKGPGLRVRGM